MSEREGQEAAVEVEADRVPEVDPGPPWVTADDRVAVTLEGRTEEVSGSVHDRLVACGFYAKTGATWQVAERQVEEDEPEPSL
jgi:hypothetical protein